MLELSFDIFLHFRTPLSLTYEGFVRFSQRIARQDQMDAICLAKLHNVIATPPLLLEQCELKDKVGLDVDLHREKLRHFFEFDAAVLDCSAKPQGRQPALVVGIFFRYLGRPNNIAKPRRYKKLERMAAYQVRSYSCPLEIRRKYRFCIGFVSRWGLNGISAGILPYVQAVGRDKKKEVSAGEAAMSKKVSSGLGGPFA